MLGGFAARKAAEVAAAVGEMRASLTQGRTNITTKFDVLTQATNSATSTLQVCALRLTSIVCFASDTLKST